MALALRAIPHVYCFRLVSDWIGGNHYGHPASAKIALIGNNRLSAWTPDDLGKQCDHDLSINGFESCLEIEVGRNILRMSAASEQAVTISVDEKRNVSGLLIAPPDARACYVLAHGAGAGMAHPFMAAIANGLAERGIATLRYQFPYMEQGSRRPDTPPLAHATVRAAVQEASRQVPKLVLVAGGKSFGGRMTSQAQAALPLTGVRGLVFLGFPLHPPGRPSNERGKHLSDVRIPMLFLQGTRDDLATLELMESLCEQLGASATLKLFPEADHSFHVPARTGRKDSEVRMELLDAVANWIHLVAK